MIDYIIPIIASVVMVHNFTTSTPHLTSTPEVVYENSYPVEVNGQKNSRVFLDGKEVANLGSNGKVLIDLDTTGDDGTAKVFHIKLKNKNNLETQELTFSINKGEVDTSWKKMKINIDAYAPKNHEFQFRNQYTPQVTFNGYIYIFSMDKDRRPYINKIKEGDSSDIQTKLIDKQSPIYKVFQDDHHRFSLGIDKYGYIHILGDMHHGGGGTPVKSGSSKAKGGSNRYKEQKIDGVKVYNPLPKRFYNNNGDQMYWVSDNPEDISSFTFMGGDKKRAIPSQDLTYAYFRTDLYGELYMATRQSSKKDRDKQSGIMSLGLYTYNADTQKWTGLGGIPKLKGTDYGLEGDLGKSFKSIVWEPYGEYREKNKVSWYQPMASNFKFDKNNRMHLTSTVNADTSHEDATHIVYAYSVNNGETFKRADGSDIKSLPIRATAKEENRGDIVLNSKSFQSVFPGLLWDENFSPAITYSKGSNDKPKTAFYRYYDYQSESYKTKSYKTDVPSIRSDHFSLSDGSMIHVGTDQLYRTDSFENNKVMISKKDDNIPSKKNSNSKTEKKYFFIGCDDALLRDKNILRGISTINGRGAITSVQF